MGFSSEKLILAPTTSYAQRISWKLFYKGGYMEEFGRVIFHCGFCDEEVRVEEMHVSRNGILRFIMTHCGKKQGVVLTAQTLAKACFQKN